MQKGAGEGNRARPRESAGRGCQESWRPVASQSSALTESGYGSAARHPTSQAASGAAPRAASTIVAEWNVRVDARLLLEAGDEARQEGGEAIGKVLGVPVDAEALRVAAREPGGRRPREGHRDGDAVEAGDGRVVERPRGLAPASARRATCPPMRASASSARERTRGECG